MISKAPNCTKVYIREGVLKGRISDKIRPCRISDKTSTTMNTITMNTTTMNTTTMNTTTMNNNTMYSTTMNNTTMNNTTMNTVTNRYTNALSHIIKHHETQITKHKSIIYNRSMTNGTSICQTHLI
jgi:hypothetical protein